MNFTEILFLVTRYYFVQNIVKDRTEELEFIYDHNNRLDKNSLFYGINLPKLDNLQKIIDQIDELSKKENI